ncbi:D(4) dopamine receptor [Aphis craccivora]|uniref:D(4) dopamine receptor n=1 Tax=Aphis craccivora TaxID=307492 RepID=A0A6G0ZMG7_APHCR|nr:D(4) dopamine receptor [Aphis craccivora]
MTSKSSHNITFILDFERSDECIDFTMMCVFFFYVFIFFFFLCLSPRFEAFKFLRNLSKTRKFAMVKITCVGFLAVLGAFLNIVVLVMFYKKPSLRSPSNSVPIFVGSLIASDLLSSTVLGPLLVSGIKTINKALTVFVATSTIFSILVIAMDRYTAVLSPLHYATNVTRQKSVLVTNPLTMDA